MHNRNRLTGGLGRWVLAACVGLCVGAAHVAADGKVFSSVMSPVTIPDQQALIHYADGVETLVIETRFVGEGGDFAWVVPLPAHPSISPVTQGLFPTLQCLFRPRIIDDVAQWAPTFFFLTVLIVTILWRRLMPAVAWLLLSLFVLCIFIPSLARSRTLGLDTTPLSGVRIHSRQLIGNYEVTTLSATQANALNQWLEDNEFRIDLASRSIIADYVRDGWCFSAVKLAAPGEDKTPRTPHPLAFTFTTARPVYPLRLTGTHEGTCGIDLYIFGPGQAVVDNGAFKLVTCRRTERMPELADSRSWKQSDLDSIAIVHAGLRGLVPGTPVATRLSGALLPSQMVRDAYISWQTYAPVGQAFFTTKAAWHLVLNYTVGAVAVVCLVLAVSVRKQRVRMSRAVVAMLVAMAVAAPTSYFCYLRLPRTAEKAAPAAAGANQSFHEQRLAEFFLPKREYFPASAFADAEAFRKRLSVLLNAEDPPFWRGFQTNNFTGAKRMEEDSPGNYQVRQTNQGLEYAWYDQYGGVRTFLVDAARRAVPGANGASTQPDSRAE